MQGKINPRKRRLVPEAPQDVQGGAKGSADAAAPGTSPEPSDRADQPPGAVDAKDSIAPEGLVKVEDAGGTREASSGSPQQQQQHAMEAGKSRKHKKLRQEAEATAADAAISLRSPHGQPPEGSPSTSGGQTETAGRTAGPELRVRSKQQPKEEGGGGAGVGPSSSSGAQAASTVTLTKRIGGNASEVTGYHIKRNEFEPEYDQVRSHC